MQHPDASFLLTLYLQLYFPLSTTVNYYQGYNMSQPSPPLKSSFQVSQSLPSILQEPPPYLQGIPFKTPNGYLKSLQILQIPVHTMYVGIHTYL